MHLHEIQPAPGSRRPAKRVGRGTGSGHGKTSGRGQKGQHARSQGFRVGFEGGQMPLAQRLPKLGGFKNPFKKKFKLVNLSRLSRFADGARVDLDAFVTEGLASPGDMVKVLGAGKLHRRLIVEAHAFSESARAAIEARGGTVSVIGAPEAPPAPPAKPSAAAEAPVVSGDLEPEPTEE